MGCIQGGATLLHLVNTDGVTRPTTVDFRGEEAGNTSSTYLVPTQKELKVERGGQGARVVIRPEDIDRVDIILRL
ncbi:MAG: hypothetical protein ACUVRX_11910 [Actinomycetota bacterium]